MVNLVVVIDDRGFQITRIPNDPEFVKPVTVEMQAKDSKLGMVACGDALSNFVRALNEAFKEAIGFDKDVLKLAAD